MTDQEGAAMAPDIVTEARQLRRWKAEAIEVIQSWERVWVALGEPGELGESKAAAALAEVERLRHELDQRTDPELAAALLNCEARHGHRRWHPDVWR